MRAIITITLIVGVLDPQGQAILQALHGLNFPEVTGAGQGKMIELDLDETDVEKAKARVADMCEKLLANTVIERYSIRLEQN